MYKETDLVGIDIDKCTESHTIKIPEILKSKIDRFSSPQKTKLKEELLFIMARHVHQNEFNPEKYLSTKG